MILNKDVANRHLAILKWGNEAWFYGYHWSKEDLEKMEAAIAYFQYITAELRVKVKQEAGE